MYSAEGIRVRYSKESESKVIGQITRFRDFGQAVTKSVSKSRMAYAKSM